jgi:hypothetical protein
MLRHSQVRMLLITTATQRNQYTSYSKRSISSRTSEKTRFSYPLLNACWDDLVVLSKMNGHFAKVPILTIEEKYLYPTTFHIRNSTAGATWWERKF